MTRDECGGTLWFTGETFYAYELRKRRRGAPDYAEWRPRRSQWSTDHGGRAFVTDDFGSLVEVPRKTVM